VSRRASCFLVLGFAATAAGNAFAQEAPAADASGGVSLSTDAGASSDASASAAAPAPEPAPAPAPAPAPVEEEYRPYEPGLPPDGNVLEIGVFGGILIPSPDHNLRYEVHPQREYKLGFEGGGRLGYYPASFLGIEGEFMAASSKVEGTNNQGVLYGYRGQLVLQVPTPYIAPFLLGGVGNLGAVSRAMGNDVDTAWHFGLGAKIPLTHILGLRLDARDNLTAHQNGDGQAHTLEVTLGLTATIERARKEPPPPPPDADHDGVIDADDKCPAEHGVAPSGCPADTDGDSVYDKDDYCPREVGPAPKGCPIIDPDPDKDGVPLPCDACPEEVGVKPDGCPIRDTDKDGILDDKDKCINEPETKNGFEDADGCPDKIPDAVKKFAGVVQGIYFQQGKSVVRPASKPTLQRAVKVLQDHQSVSFEISGHTSSEGDPDFNNKLSQDRADAVKQWIVDQGIDPKRLRTRGAGSTEPIADNKSAAGREKNRRIEFKVIE
jgi:outer membrane protein OmpA-like peptidoglycan-associated protein